MLLRALITPLLFSLVVLLPAHAQTEDIDRNSPLTCRVVELLKGDPPVISLEILSLSGVDLLLDKVGLFGTFKDLNRGSMVSGGTPFEMQEDSRKLLLQRGQPFFGTFRVGLTKRDLSDFIQYGASVVRIDFYNLAGDIRYPCQIRGLDLQQLASDQTNGR